MGSPCSPECSQHNLNSPKARKDSDASWEAYLGETERRPDPAQHRTITTRAPASPAPVPPPPPSPSPTPVELHNLVHSNLAV